MDITKAEAKARLGIQTDVALGRLLGISGKAVSQWPEADPIPEGRQWQLRALRPDLWPVPEAATPDGQQAA
jgi:hypothetical protein